MGRRSYHSIILLALVALLWGSVPTRPVAAAPSAQDTAQEPDGLATYEISIENLTTGQPFSLPIFATHSGDVRMFHVNEVATEEMAAIAQAGNPTPMVNLLSDLEGVTDVVLANTPLTPQGISAEINGAAVDNRVSVSIQAAPGDYLSLATMLICTNDGFAGLDSAQLPEDGTELFIELNAYDVGREENTELSADIVDACSALGAVTLDGDPNRNVDDGDVLTDPAQPILLHRNVRGEGDLDPDVHGWENPVALISIVRTDLAEEDDAATAEDDAPSTEGESGSATLPPTEPASMLVYELMFQNVTRGQPFSPPVVVTHAPDVHMFQLGETASDPLAAIAQAGNPEPMVDFLVGVDGVTEVVNLGQPLTPAGIITEVNGVNVFNTAIFTVTAAPGDVVSLAAMLICTNDGFVGLDGAALPTEGQQTYLLNAYDAGREENTELSEDLVDACSALGPLSLARDDNGNVDDGDVLTDPADPVASHPGIIGEGDLDADAHGWQEPVATLTISVREAMTTAEAAPLDPGLITIESSNGFTETVEGLQQALEAQGLNVFAVIDHAANAASADLELLPTTLILVGNPNIGTPLMQSSRTAGIDLPQKFLVWEAEDGVIFITYNDPAYLATRHDITDQAQIVEQVTNALSTFAARAATPVE